MRIRHATKKIATVLLLSIAGLSLLQVTVGEQQKRLEVPVEESIPYLKVPLPPELAPFQASMILNGLRLQPGGRITLITSPFRKDEVAFLQSISQDAFRDIGITINQQGPNLLLSVPPNPQLKNKVVFVNTWDGQAEIGLSELRQNIKLASDSESLSD